MSKKIPIHLIKCRNFYKKVKFKILKTRSASKKFLLYYPDADAAKQLNS